MTTEEMLLIALAVVVIIQITLIIMVLVAIRRMVVRFQLAATEIRAAAQKGTSLFGTFAPVGVVAMSILHTLKVVRKLRR